MQEILLKLTQFLESIGEGIGRAVSWLTSLMVLVAFAVVVLRYAFDFGWIALQESVSYMHAAVFMLGAAFTLKHGGHVRVDVFHRGFGDKTRALVDLLGTLLLLLPVTIFIVWSSWGYVADAWRVAESSRESGGLPWVYWLKSLIPVMGGMLLLQGIANILRNFLVFAGVSATPLPEQETEPSGGNLDLPGDGI
ncbi:MAG: TRAP transporter small permease subunit [Gammaproteobacteria bacterium]|nr:TRAP transporter small permease subunit [Gammaproteobacteria bacterium]MBU1653654.1 TRAP transporter small permease subunit [Gammaproteobacteria bacterium]MBU1962484.1 TRAP transporter small permease subunit [Gammaproteobacteria bacterium]